MSEESRIAMIAIVVENSDSVAQMNEILHEFSQWIVGRMGIPYRARHVNLISIAIDAPMDIINSLTGRIGALDGISVKAAVSRIS